MRALPGVALIPAVLLAASHAMAAGPSFDCRRAASDDEVAICGDAHLSQLDRLLALAYDETQHVSGRAKGRAAAREGLAARRACGGDTECILSAQIDLIRTFQNLGANVELPAWAEDSSGDGGQQPPAEDDAGGLPTEVGQCVNTAIARITSRFQEDINASADDGSAVEFDNGGRQVSYDKEQALIDSRVGDAVLMCLVELPQDCPPGDDRGKIYTTTNLRTQQSWTLPDSQHSCGGA